MGCLRSCSGGFWKRGRINTIRCWRHITLLNTETHPTRADTHLRTHTQTHALMDQVYKDGILLIFCLLVLCYSLHFVTVNFRQTRTVALRVQEPWDWGWLLNDRMMVPSILTWSIRLTGLHPCQVALSCHILFDIYLKLLYRRLLFL